MGKCPFKNTTAFVFARRHSINRHPPTVIENVGFGPKVQKLASRDGFHPSPQLVRNLICSVKTAKDWFGGLATAIPAWHPSTAPGCPVLCRARPPPPGRSGGHRMRALKCNRRTTWDGRNQVRWPPSNRNRCPPWIGIPKFGSCRYYVRSSAHCFPAGGR
jgi:hypothetical protein